MSTYEFITCLNCGGENSVLTEKKTSAVCGSCKEKLANGTLYDVLELSKSASPYQIKQSYRKLAMKWHPDKNQDNVQVATARFKRISYAYEVLTNPDTRKKYDASLNSESNNAHSKPQEPEMDFAHATNIFVEEMYRVAIELAFKNNNWTQIAPLLIQKGCPVNIAEAIARSCVDYRKTVIRKAALKPFITGLIALSIGGIITMATYNAASNGGTYLVAYGPILYGAYKMLVALKHIIAGKVHAPKNFDA